MAAQPLSGNIGRHHGPRRRGLQPALVGWSLAFLCLLLAGSASGFDGDSLRAQQVKAAFILNIARFVSWPAGTFPDADAPLLLCLYQGDPLDGAIHSIRGKPVSGHPLEIVEIDRYASADACQILLVPSDRLQMLAEDIAGESKPALLTISDLTLVLQPIPDHHHPVMVTLERVGTRIGIEINLDEVRSAGLRVSAELLKLARIREPAASEVRP